MYISYITMVVTMVTTVEARDNPIRGPKMIKEVCNCIARSDWSS